MFCVGVLDPLPWLPDESCCAVEVARFGRAERDGVGGREEEDEEELWEERDELDEEEDGCHADVLVSSAESASWMKGWANGSTLEVSETLGVKLLKAEEPRVSRRAWVVGEIESSRLMGIRREYGRKVGGLEGEVGQIERVSMQCSSGLEVVDRFQSGT